MFLNITKHAKEELLLLLFLMRSTKLNIKKALSTITIVTVQSSIQSHMLTRRMNNSAMQTTQRKHKTAAPTDTPHHIRIDIASAILCFQADSLLYFQHISPCVCPVILVLGMRLLVVQQTGGKLKTKSDY